jgi:hypothetical protein
VKNKRSSAPLLLAVVAAVAVAAVAWFALFTGSSAQNEAAAAPSSGGAMPAASRAAAVEAPVDAPRRVDDAAPEELARAAIDDNKRVEFSDAVWIEGRVVFPEGTPLDERVEVIADGKDFKNIGDHRVTAGTDGSFRVAFSPEGKTGWLKIKASYLHLDKPVRVKLSKDAEPVVLEPLLGGRIVGRITPPPGASDAPQVLAKAKLRAQSWGETFGMVSIEGKIDEDFNFELRGVGAAREHRIELDSKEWVQFSKGDVTVKPGETLQLDIQLELGARFSGVVVDAQGKPVERAEVELRKRSDDGDFWRNRRDVNTDESGVFRITGISAGEYEVKVRARNYLEHSKELGAFADGDARDGQRVVLDSGRSVSGIVKWSDGAIASGAFVRVELAGGKEGDDEFEFSMEDRLAVRTGLDGRFSIAGLTGNAFNVYAHAKDGSRADSASKSDGKVGRLKGAKWRGQVLNVSGTSPVEVVLKPGFGVSGRVVDELGQPVKKFWITGRTDSTAGGLEGVMGEQIKSKFEAEDGRFTLEGLTNATWSIAARATGYTPSPSTSIVMPHDGELTFVVKNNAAVRGTVVDPAGKPVAKARIELEWDRPDESFDLSDLNRGATADGKGVFRISNAPSGKVTLKASHASFADSAPLELELAPGASVEDVRMVLTRGGTLRVRLHERLNASEVSWRAQLWGQGDWKNETIDASGQCEFTGLTAGEYQVSISQSGNGRSRFQFAARNDYSESVEVVDGSVTEVVLGEPAGEFIVLSGRATMGGQPLAGVTVDAYRDDFNTSGTTGADGAYTLTLEGAGSYYITARLERGGAQEQQQLEVVGGSSPVLDFDFPTGRIAGRVLDRTGKVMGGANVSAQLVAAAEGETRQDAYVRDDANGKGEFELSGLAPGTYRLIVEDDTNWRRREARFARTVVEGVKLEGAALSGVEVRVDAPAKLTVIVTKSDGSPAARAQVRVSSTLAGRVDPYLESERADGSGRAVLGGLATGDYLISASLGDEVGAPSAAVRVVSGEAAEAFVQISPGGYISVQVENADGSRSASGANITDAAGRDWGGLAEWDMDEDADTLRLGPLPTGTYSVSLGEGDAQRATSTRVTSGATATAVLPPAKE